MAAVALALLLTPGVVAIVDDVGNFTPDLRDASLVLAERFGEGDVLLTSAGRSELGVASRLYGAYAALEAGEGRPLSEWTHLGDATGCTLVDRLAAQRPAPTGAWLLLRAPETEATVTQLARAGAVEAERYGEFVIARMQPRGPTVGGALRAGSRAYRAADAVNEDTRDFRNVALTYRIAVAYERSGLCR